MLMPAELKGCVTWLLYFLNLLWLRYNCQVSSLCDVGGFIQILGRRGLFAPPIREQPRESPSWIGLTLCFLRFKYQWRKANAYLIKPYACSFSINKSHGIQSNAFERSIRTVHTIFLLYRCFFQFSNSFHKNMAWDGCFAVCSYKVRVYFRCDWINYLSNIFHRPLRSHWNCLQVYSF